MYAGRVYHQGPSVPISLHRAAAHDANAPKSAGERRWRRSRARAHHRSIPPDARWRAPMPCAWASEPHPRASPCGAVARARVMTRRPGNRSWRFARRVDAGRARAGLRQAISS